MIDQVEYRPPANKTQTSGEKKKIVIKEVQVQESSIEEVQVRESINENQIFKPLMDEISKFDKNKQAFFSMVLNSIKQYEQWKRKNKIEKITIEYYDKVENMITIDKKQMREKAIEKQDVLQVSSEIQLIVISLFKIYEIQEQRYRYLFPFQLELQNQNQRQFNYEIKEIQQFQIMQGNIFNSNIINAYANYLMIEDEKNYFNLNRTFRQQYKRLYIIRSELLSDAMQNQIQSESKELLNKFQLFFWLKYLDDFKAIQYQFWLIYKRIGIIVNQNGGPWFFIQISFDERQLIVFDPMRKVNSPFLSNLVVMLNFIFQELTREQQFQFTLTYANVFPQVNDETSCGGCTCIAAEYLSQQSKQKMKSIPEIMKILQQLFVPHKEIIE